MLAGPILALVLVSLLPGSRALAQCTPAAGPSLPVPGTTVTCSGAVVNQGPAANTGYGDGSQTGLTINVQSAASVTGLEVTGAPAGMRVGGGNTINNSGSIGTISLFNSGTGIDASTGDLTVNNSGSITASGVSSVGIQTESGNVFVTNNAGGTISGSFAAISALGLNLVGPGNSATVTNSGIISSNADGGINTIFASDTINLTNNAGGQVLGGGPTSSPSTLSANRINVTNLGLISAIGVAPVAINASLANVNGPGTVNVNNSGTIEALGDPFSGGGTAIWTQVGTVVNNSSGTINATGLLAIGIQGNTITVINAGTITASGPASFGILANTTANIINTGTISGETGIIIGIVGPTGATVFNAGTITGTVGPAIQFQGGGNTLTLAPTSIINGNVIGTATDTFQLGGSGTGTFDLTNIGPAQQYQGFGIFQKVGDSTWTLVGSGTQDWSVQSGRLAVNGTDSGTFTVTGGILGGTGTIGGLVVQSGGTVGPGNSIGTLNVSGNVNFGAGSFYQVEVNAAGQSDRIAATGTTTLSGGTVQVLAAAGNYG